MTKVKVVLVGVEEIVKTPINASYPDGPDASEMVTWRPMLKPWFDDVVTVAVLADLATFEIVLVMLGFLGLHLKSGFRSAMFAERTRMRESIFGALLEVRKPGTATEPVTTAEALSTSLVYCW